ncbi:MAG: 30S ribosomal protein S8 [Phycisphaerae bacterium]|nr:30S ribosomal protein S8 [Phycisphaerae bacterium]
MSFSDPIADMLTRIRNALAHRAKSVDVLNSRVCRGIAAVLRDEGYIASFETVEDARQGLIRIKLKYGPRGEPALHTLVRRSKPGCRVYAGVEELPRPLQGLGIFVVSTSRGVMSDRKCRTERVGGELLCTIE